MLAKELEQLGFAGVKVGRAGCHFRGAWIDVQRANLYSRIATRILVELNHRPIRTEADVAALAMDTAWERWFGSEQTLRVDTSAIQSPFKSLQYCNLLTKDGICDRLRAKEGTRPSIDTVRPDARVHLFLSDSTATMYLDTTGESLFKRGWRLDKGEAPLKENLAAGLLMLSGWEPGMPLFDPFCGSGTILIEAAWMALNIPPGINRPFGFERLRHHDKMAWQGLRQNATANIRTHTDTRLVGSDTSWQAIDAALQNMSRAGLPTDTIQFTQANALEVQAPDDHGLIVTNPPYGERLEQSEGLMSAWASQLKREFAGWSVHVISADMNLPSSMRLKAKRRTPVFNGALDCRLFEFELVAASYRDPPSVGFKQQP
jgi:putative N6-adenine-specific DNA methylase